MSKKSDAKHRTELERLVRQQREANAEMVAATVHAQEMTEKADAARGKSEASERELVEEAEFRELFIGIAGHDLRNPLGAIDMAANQLLKRGHLDERDQRAATLILRSAVRMKEIIHLLVELTRARLGGGVPIEPRSCDLREVCRDVAQEFEAPIEVIAEGDVTGLWDPGRLAEGLSNILKNATEHAKSGSAIVVAVRAEGADVVVEITNEGSPIPADLLPVLFEPFRRGPRGKSESANLGLGLYISHQIVLSHGGSLAAHSGDGKTTFVMRLPRHSLQRDAARALTRRRPGKGGTRGGVAGRRQSLERMPPGRGLGERWSGYLLWHGLFREDVAAL
ncbi:MAG: sensor histidine kinase [Myxococcales bacterium]